MRKRITAADVWTRIHCLVRPARRDPWSVIWLKVLRRASGALCLVTLTHGYRRGLPCGRASGARLSGVVYVTINRCVEPRWEQSQRL